MSVTSKAEAIRRAMENFEKDHGHLIADEDRQHWNAVWHLLGDLVEAETFGGR
jgi:hypothetical protein